MGKDPQSAKVMTSGRPGDHLMVICQDKAAEVRTLQLLLMVATRNSYRMLLACERQRLDLLQRAFDALDAERVHYIPIDLSLRAMKDPRYEWAIITLEEMNTLRAANFLDRPLIAFTAFPPDPSFSNDPWGDLMKVERHWTHVMKAHPTMAVCAYPESDSFGPHASLGRVTFQKMTSLHGGYLKAPDRHILEAMGPSRRGSVG
jgi:hypothetical protein